MTDLQEIRRFWPWMPPPHVDYLGHKDYQCRRRGVHYLAHRHQAQWWVSAVNQHSRSWSEVFVDEDGYRIGGGDTIAAAMAAAGFAQRPIGRYRETFNQYADRLNDKAMRYRAWHDRRYRDKPIMPLADACKRHDDGTRLWPVLLESRQRPRKGVRLGKQKHKEVPW